MSVSSSTLGNTRQKYKLVFLGDQSVGKSSMIERYITNAYDQSLNPTVGIDFYIKNLSRNNRQYRLQLWDTAGQERFRSLIPSYMKDADCAIIVFDVSEKKTFEDLHVWNNMFEEYRQLNAIKALIGNKIDLSDSREVDKTEAEKYAQKIGAKYFQISAKTGKKLDQAFNCIVDLIAQRSDEGSKLEFIKEEGANQQDQQNGVNKKDLKETRSSQQGFLGSNGKGFNFKIQNDPIGVQPTTDQKKVKIKKDNKKKDACCSK